MLAACAAAKKGSGCERRTPIWWLPCRMPTALLALLIWWPRVVLSQMILQPDVFASSVRAAAATQAVLVAVQQGISSLPPTSGLSFIYEFDPSVEVPVRSEQPGPISL